MLVQRMLRDRFHDVMEATHRTNFDSGLLLGKTLVANCVDNLLHYIDAEASIDVTQTPLESIQDRTRLSIYGNEAPIRTRRCLIRCGWLRSVTISHNVSRCTRCSLINGRDLLMR